jgi:Transport and Golgi organisation 2
LAGVEGLLGGCGFVSLGQLMCTVSFEPSAGGFYLAMNRDEKCSRVQALPPSVVRIGGIRAVYPREPGGGTWISVSENGVCLALINWHRITGEPAGSVLSRGQVIIELAGARSADEITNGIKNLPLRQFRPFRLIAIAPRPRTVTEWRWNLKALRPRRHEWGTQHWFSSGFDELEAEAQRRRVCRQWRKQSAVHGPRGLRRLHRSHAPERGPFSICMHRADAATLSYTEVAVTTKFIRMSYFTGPPCRARVPVTRRIQSATASSLHGSIAP